MKKHINYKIYILAIALIATLGIYHLAPAQHEEHEHEKHDSEIVEQQKPCCPEEELEAHDDHEHETEETHEEVSADDHEDCDHEMETEVDMHDDHEAEIESADSHEGHDHGEEGDSHEDEGGLSLNEEQLKNFGVQIKVAGSGSIHTEKSFPGEVKVNTDRLARVLPRATGIVREVYVTLGDTVKKGDLLALIESAELGEAKVAYLNAISEINCCAMDLTRAQEIHDNTLKFISRLKANPSLQQLREQPLSAMGENGSLLVSSYSELFTERANFEREKTLYEKKISSRQEFEAADNALKKAEAEYEALIDTVNFNIKKQLAEANEEQARQNADASGAERRLMVLGMSPGEIAALRNEELTPGVIGSDTESEVEICTDPECAGCSGHGTPAIVSNALDMLGCYTLRAPLDGMVIEKLIAPGEKVEDDEIAFTVADLSRVWVDFNVFQQNIPHLTEGQKVKVKVPENHQAAEAVVDYISPLVNERTRTVMARVVLPNENDQWRPGLFVDVVLETSGEEVSIAIPKSAVQNIDGENVVFVQSGEGFSPAVIQPGHSNSSTVEVLSGLKPGQHYVAQGAFELKAHMLTQSMDPHAGHGH